MLSINTNLSSFAVQNNLTKSTNSLNQAIERMTTGFKLNHSSDNAAGYSIANSMVSHLSSYDVAADNISAGMDLVKTAQDTISLMQNHGQRIHALITQAQNGTYGNSSLAAINSEVSARIAEINRLYKTTEYNDKALLQGVQLPDWTEEVKANAATTFTDSVTGEVRELKAQENGFIDSIVEVTPDIVVESAADLEDAINNNAIIGIANADVLAELAKIVNGTDGYTANDCSGKTITLTDDIDLSDYQSGSGWTPIGTQHLQFKGTFDGQGYTISNIYQKKNSAFSVGLFTMARNATIKNLGIVNADIITNGDHYGGGALAFSCNNVQNCYVTGKVNITGDYFGNVGGLIAIGNAKNCYTTCDVSTNSANTGGVVGNGSATNCYSTGNIKTKNNSENTCAGGIAGYGAASNCYATGDVSGVDNVGGIVGKFGGSVSNCYFLGNVSGNYNIGGIAGVTLAQSTIINCCSYGTVSGSSCVGGILGKKQSFAINETSLSGCFSTAAISGSEFVGGIVGLFQHDTNKTKTIENICSTGIVTATGETQKGIGSLIGGIINTSDGTTFSDITIKGGHTDSSDYGFIGGVYSSASGNPDVEYDMSEWFSNISVLPNSKITLLVGINANESSSMTFDCAFSYDLSKIIKNGAEDSGSYDIINEFLATLSDRSTKLGAVTDRLESALESTTVSMKNLTSSLSTVRDADIAKESSQYIKNQILQQASATLLATANQTPSIALQLI